MSTIKATEILTRDEGSRKLGAVTFVLSTADVPAGMWVGVSFSRPFIDANYVVLLTVEAKTASLSAWVMERHNFGFKLGITAREPGPVTVHWQADAAIPAGPGELPCGLF